MLESSRDYIPAAGNHWSLPFYDPIVRLLGADAARTVLVDQAAVEPGDRVLEVGCGTGSLLMLVKRRHPNAEVIGLDPDPKALARAEQKAQRAGVELRLDRGFADVLPYADASIDRVLSSLMLHHLRGDEKAKMLAEARRVLKPGGALVVLDLAGPESGHGFLARLFHSTEILRENSEERVLTLMRQAGFANPRKVRQGSMFFGGAHVSYYEGTA